MKCNLHITAGVPGAVRCNMAFFLKAKFVVSEARSGASGVYN